MNVSTSRRRAIVVSRSTLNDLRTVARLLPDNYVASYDRQRACIVIEGRDEGGWSLDDYVLPRLGSALITAREAF